MNQSSPLITVVTSEGKMKQTTKYAAATCLTLSVLLAPVIAQQGITRTTLQTVDFPPGYQTVSGLAQVPPNTCTARHNHPGSEFNYIIEGDAALKVDGKPDQQFKTGDSWQLAAGFPHIVCTTSGLKGLTVHVIEKGKPLASTMP
jgi:quercetin dioxygenase-like cupin family protein